MSQLSIVLERHINLKRNPTNSISQRQPTWLARNANNPALDDLCLSYTSQDCVWAWGDNPLGSVLMNGRKSKLEHVALIIPIYLNNVLRLSPSTSLEICPLYLFLQDEIDSISDQSNKLYWDKPMWFGQVSHLVFSFTRAVVKCAHVMKHWMLGLDIACSYLYGHW